MSPEQLFPAIAGQRPAQAPIARETMAQYYTRWFPLSFLDALLTHAEPEAFPWTHREISFTFAGESGEHEYSRNHWFNNATELKRELARRVPVKLDIGAVHSMCVRYRTTAGYKPVLRELVFDIDVSDYDRQCCANPKTACAHCWRYAACAVEVLDHLLRARLGFRKLLWVFSGRRGVHCWVMDRKAAPLGRNSRSFVLAWLASPDARDRLSVDACVRWFVDIFERHPRSVDEAMHALWPRLDAAVTRTPSHLIKSPFCVHPGTGKLCLAFQARKVAEFEFDRVPTAQQVVDDAAGARRALHESAESALRALAGE